jgi:hypothetical protein
MLKKKNVKLNLTVSFFKPIKTLEEDRQTQQFL